MTRPVRQVDDRAAVLARPADHQPSRPGWACTQCGSDWPCVTYREHLLDSLRGDRSAVQSVMAGYYPMALVELREERAVYERLYAWARHPVGRPAGGPL